MYEYIERKKPGCTYKLSRVGNEKRKIIFSFIGTTAVKEKNARMYESSCV